MIEKNQLRREAEARLAQAPEEFADLAPEEIRQTLHELRVHQVELEMQNEELLRTQVELKSTQARYFDLYDLAPVGYVTLSESGRILEANLTAATLLGVARGKLAGHSFFGYILTEDHDAYYLAHKQLFASGQAQVCEVRMMKQDGTLLWVCLEANAAQASDGKAVSRVVLSDISVRKLAEAALRASEEKFRAIADYTVDWESWFGPDGTYLWVNPAVERITGYTREEVLAMPNFVSVLIAEEDRARFRSCFQEALLGVPGENFEFRYLHKNGATHWLSTSWQSIFDSSGQCLGIRTSGHNITARKRTEAELTESENRWRRAVACTPVPVMIHDEEGRVLQLSAGWTTFSGYTIEDIPRLADWMERAYGIRKGYTKEHIDHLFSIDQTIHNGEFFITAKDGSKRLWDFQTTPLGTLEGSKRVLHSMAIDITERKHAEEMLEKSLHEKEFLLKEIHHRVQNNLQIINSLLRLQSDRIDNPIAKAALQDMQNRVRSMALIHEHLYRSENFAAVDLADYLTVLCQQLVRTLALAPSTIQLHLQLAPARLGIDQAIPCGLLVNELVSNALKHAFPNGRGGALRVELQALADGAGWHLRVADNGVGLPPGLELSDLTSLGLKLVYHLARQLGARLDIGTGPGAVFDLEFKARGA